MYISLPQILLIVLLVTLSVIVVAIGILAVVLARDTPRSTELVRTWAERNGYRIIHAKRRYVFTGPFPQVTTRGAQVFRVEIEDPHGRARSGWVLCGSGWWGTDPNKVTVRWDK